MNGAQGIFKIEYLQDEKTHKWRPFKSDGRFETVLLGNRSNVAWCDFHSRWETFSKNEHGITTFQCGYSTYKPTLHAYEKKLSSIMFTINMDSLMLDVSFRTSMPYFSHSKKVVSKTSEVSHFNLATGTTSIEHNNGKEIFFSEDLELEKVPEEIQNSIQNTLSLMSKKIYGVPCKNTYKLCQNGFKHFVKYPSCPPIANVKPCFREKVNRKSLHSFEDLCALYGIKPGKKFRKMFLDNPSTFLVNVFLSCIGFKDSNVFNKYYNNAALIRFLEEHLSCVPTLPQMILLFNDNKNMLALHKWYENASKTKNDSVCANHLIEPILDGRTTTQTMTDAFYMYVDKYDRLPEPLKKRIIKEGFTTDVHDRMCEALNRNRRDRSNRKVNEEITYTEDELSLEHKVTKTEKDPQTGEEVEKILYNFELPKDTDDLYLISDKMRNCVGYAYRDKVLDKHCLIITLEDKPLHKGVACMEVISSNGKKFDEIRQALGPCNRRIENKYIPVIQHWMKLHHLSTSCFDLKEERVLRDE